MSIPAVTSASPAFGLAAEIREGLSRRQRELPSKYLYDEVGSALFEAICALPEYGLSRAGERLLYRHAGDLLPHLPPSVMVAELGSGSGRKTRHVLEALSRRHPTVYYPIEISRAALQQSERELGQLPCVYVVGVEREYLDGLADVARRRQPGQCLLVLFLGSTIGNFDRPEALKFLRQVRATLQAGDALFLATDLEKPVDIVLRAYDDPAGVTAAFNKNLVCRINRELGGDFDTSLLEHVARYDFQHRRVEMHLRATAPQTVRIAGADFTFQLEEGETLWTESSHKFAPDEAAEMGRNSGFHCVARWLDPEWAFGHYLLRAV